MATYTPTTNPMIIPAPALTATTTIVMTRPVLAKRIEWYVPVTMGDSIQATDLNGNVIIEGTCEVASQSQILWTGPNKLAFKGTLSNTAGSWQVINKYSAASTAALIIWWG
jgi:hypothetical protein